MHGDLDPMKKAKEKRQRRKVQSKLGHTDNKYPPKKVRRQIRRA